MGLDLADQPRAQWVIVPRIPADEALQGQAGLAQTIRHCCDIFAFDVRPQAPHRGFGVLLGGLPLAAGDKGLHEGVEAWNDLLEHLRGELTFVKQWAFAQGVSRFHGMLLL